MVSSQSLNEDLHSTTKSENQMEGRFLLNVVILKSTSIFELLSCKDKSLLIWRDTFLILDLSLDIFDGVTLFNIQVIVFPVSVLTKICMCLLFLKLFLYYPM